MDKLTKKERLTINREIIKMKKIFCGIQDMKKIPAAVFVVDTCNEEIAVKEAHKLDIPVFAILDTNCDPDLIDYPIPGNDDSSKSIGVIIRALADAVLEGRSKLEEKIQQSEEKKVKTEKEKEEKEKAVSEEEKVKND